MKWEAVFFDFDGVILDSIDVKTRAFAKMFRKYGPEVEKKVVQFHLANGGMSRFEKFKHYYETILNKHIDKKEIETLSNQFSEIVVDKVLSAPFISGAIESLTLLKETKIPTYIISGTPEKEIKFIVDQMGLKNFFEGVYGSPKKKSKICQCIIEQKGYNPYNCLFIGDAMTDYNAARKNNTRFLGIVPNKNGHVFPYGTPVSEIVTFSITSHNGLK